MKVSEKGRSAPDARAETPLQPMEKPTEKQAVPLQPMEAHGGADTHLQPTEDPTPEPVDVPKENCDPVGSPRWGRLLTGPVEQEQLRQVCWQGL